MADGAQPAPAVVLKIGFLNEDLATSRRVAAYEDAFDLLIVGDGSFAPVQRLLEDVIAGGLTRGGEDCSGKWQW